MKLLKLLFIGIVLVLTLGACSPYSYKVETNVTVNNNSNITCQSNIGYSNETIKDIRIITTDLKDSKTEVTTLETNVPLYLVYKEVCLGDEVYEFYIYRNGERILRSLDGTNLNITEEKTNWN